MPVNIHLKARKVLEQYLSQTPKPPSKLKVAANVWHALLKEAGYDAKRHGAIQSFNFLGVPVEVDDQMKPGMIRVG